MTKYGELWRHDFWRRAVFAAVYYGGTIFDFIPEFEGLADRIKIAIIFDFCEFLFY